MYVCSLFTTAPFLPISLQNIPNCSLFPFWGSDGARPPPQKSADANPPLPFSFSWVYFPCKEDLSRLLARKLKGWPGGASCFDRNSCGRRCCPHHHPTPPKGGGKKREARSCRERRGSLPTLRDSPRLSGSANGTCERHPAALRPACNRRRCDENNRVFTAHRLFPDAVGLHGPGLVGKDVSCGPTHLAGERLDSSHQEREREDKAGWRWADVHPRTASSLGDAPALEKIQFGFVVVRQTQ